MTGFGANVVLESQESCNASLTNYPIERMIHTGIDQREFGKKPVERFPALRHLERPAGCIGKHVFLFKLNAGTMGMSR